MTTDDPRGEVVVVTGASRGIGAAAALLAAGRGHSVAVNYAHDAKSADGIVRACVDLGVQAIAVQCDVGDESAVVAMFDTVSVELGAPTVLVNNAGILEQQMRFDEMGVDRWERMLRVNVIGAFLCAREAIRRMSTRHGGAGGSIVNVSSAASSLGSPNEYVDYAASKGAIDTLTIGLGKEVAAEGIRVNAVRPGVIRTSIHAAGGEPGRVDRVAPAVPMQRGGEPIEVARTIMWLASDEASYVTGAIVDCTGGR